MTNTDTPGEGLDPKALEAAAIETGGFVADQWPRLFPEQREMHLDKAGKIVRAYLSVIGSDTAGLPSDHAGLAADDSVAKVWDVLVAGGWRPPVVPSSAISEAIAALSRAPEAEVWRLPDVETVLREMCAVATGEYEGHDDICDPWTAENRADIDRWQAAIRSNLATPPAPQPPVVGDVVDSVNAIIEDILERHAEKNPSTDELADYLRRIPAALSASPPQGGSDD